MFALHGTISGSILRPAFHIPEIISKHMVQTISLYQETDAHMRNLFGLICPPLTLAASYFGTVVHIYPMERTFQTIQQQYKILAPGPEIFFKKIITFPE